MTGYDARALTVAHDIHPTAHLFLLPIIFVHVVLGHPCLNRLTKHFTIIFIEVFEYALGMHLYTLLGVCILQALKFVNGNCILSLSG